MIVEPLTPELRRLVPSAGDAGWATVERYGGRPVKVCATGDDLARLTATARGAAWTYGAVFTASHPATLAAGPEPCALGQAAECAYDPELHTGPDAPESPEQESARVAVARQVCETCPVRALCLPYALASAPADGVWAGYTADELAALARPALAS
ncbi:WhiB family transcriptional regulator [Herbidospora galbida]|uniref:WhiB family transcriptional regulator n=1 Tax=Herbidospora galbida TaxID=2575442 RepID=UPI0014852871|nr:WhiB family transcriptional regulator [Herbidospora galbida]